MRAELPTSDMPQAAAGANAAVDLRPASGRSRFSNPMPEAPMAGEVFAVLAIVWPAATIVVTAILFWLRVPIGPFNLWSGLLVALIAAWAISGDRRSLAAATAGMAVVTVSGGAALAWLYDFSGDGQWYHLPAVLALSQGWNPFEQPRLGIWNAGFSEAISHRPSAAIYVQHYAKGTWIVAAAAFRATGLLESSKVVNLVYFLAVYLFAVPFLSRVGVQRHWSHGLALAAAANPVILYQLPSFFVDGQVAALCTLLVLLSLDYLRRQRAFVLLLVGACVISLVNVKFTGSVFAFSLGVGLLLPFWFKRERLAAWRYAATGIVSAIIAVAFVGYQPYVTNFQLHGNPYFPVFNRDQAASEETAGQFERWAPEQFMAMNRAEKVVRSLLAESSGAASMPNMKVPFTITKRELYIFFSTEPRYGGFGPFFGSVLLATLLLILLRAHGMDRRALIGAGAIAMLLTASALLNREAWWARLSPQLWLVPIVLLTAIALGNGRWSRRGGTALLVVLLVNSALVAALNWGRAVEKNVAFRKQLEELRTRSQSGALEIAMHSSFRMVTEHRLRAVSIQYSIAPQVSCRTPFRFSYPDVAKAVACPSPPR